MLNKCGQVILKNSQHELIRCNLEDETVEVRFLIEDGAKTMNGVYILSLISPYYLDKVS